MAATTRTSTWTARRRADRPHLALLQHAQQLHLQRRRRVADLVEEHRAAVRLLEDALVIGHRAGERAAHVAEQLGLEQRLGERAAVDRHERTARAPAVAVDRARDQLLAGAALARDQHRRRRVGGVRDLLVDGEHPGRCGRRSPAGTSSPLCSGSGDARRPRASARSTVALTSRDVERLADVVEGAGAHGCDGGLQRAEAADQHDLPGRVRRP